MNRFIFYNNALRQFMKQKNTRYVWLVPCNITELNTYSLWNLPCFWKQGAKFLFKVHQSSLYPGITPVYLVQPGHLSKKTTVIYVNVQHTPCLRQIFSIQLLTYMHIHVYMYDPESIIQEYLYIWILRIQNSKCCVHSLPLFHQTGPDILPVEVWQTKPADPFWLWNPKHQQLNRLPLIVFDLKDHTVL